MATTTSLGVRPDNSFKVSGIDNDQCLGSKVHNPDDIRRGLRNKPGRVFRSCGLPPVIDTDMARTFELLTPDRVRQLLGDKLKPAEVDATVHRLSAIKDHIAHLRQEGRVIKPDGWADAQGRSVHGFHQQLLPTRSQDKLGSCRVGQCRCRVQGLGILLTTIAEVPQNVLMGAPGPDGVVSYAVELDHSRQRRGPESRVPVHQGQPPFDQGAGSTSMPTVYARERPYPTGTASLSCCSA